MTIGIRHLEKQTLVGVRSVIVNTGKFGEQKIVKEKTKRRENVIKKVEENITYINNAGETA